MINWHTESYMWNNDDFPWNWNSDDCSLTSVSTWKDVMSLNETLNWTPLFLWGLWMKMSMIALSVGFTSHCYALINIWSHLNKYNKTRKGLKVKFECNSKYYFNRKEFGLYLIVRITETTSSITYLETSA